jgi:hypothetical protein
MQKLVTMSLTNSNKDIELIKLAIHEPFCIKFVTKCEICEEPINIDEIKDHMKENHSKVECPDCSKKLEKRLLSSHKKRCSQKPSKCQFCEILVSKEDLHEHEYMCGSKTDNCYKCNKPIPIRGKTGNI